MATVSSSHQTSFHLSRSDFLIDYARNFLFDEVHNEATSFSLAMLAEH